jgi:hypothetical protein
VDAHVVVLIAITTMMSFNRFILGAKTWCKYLSTIVIHCYFLEPIVLEAKTWCKYLKSIANDDCCFLEPILLLLWDYVTESVHVRRQTHMWNRQSMCGCYFHMWVICESRHMWNRHLWPSVRLICETFSQINVWLLFSRSLNNWVCYVLFKSFFCDFNARRKKFLRKFPNITHRNVLTVMNQYVLWCSGAMIRLWYDMLWIWFDLTLICHGFDVFSFLSLYFCWTWTRAAAWKNALLY